MRMPKDKARGIENLLVLFYINSEFNGVSIILRSPTGLMLRFTVLTWCKFEDFFEFSAEEAYIIKTCAPSNI